MCDCVGLILGLETSLIGSFVGCEASLHVLVADQIVEDSAILPQKS
jgi:hypothetical protein